MIHYQIILERPINQALVGQNDRCYVDTFQDESISLNYNIADILDLSNKNSSYSKTIKLPNTKNNQQVFSDIWSLNYQYELYGGGNITFFNPNLKVKCFILKDNVIQFEGNLQLTNIEYDVSLENFVYSVVVYSENDGLFKTIGEGYLSDLDLSRYDHVWNGTNVYNSWFANYGDGYYYPMIDYGTPLTMTREFRVWDFKPAVYVKTIWRQIFSEAGYSYVSDFLDSEFFSHLIMPYSNKNIAGSVNLNLGPQKQILVISQNNPATFSYVLSNPGAAVGTKYIQGQSLYLAGYMKGDFPNYNPNNLYNFTQSWYQNPSSGRFAQKIKITIGGLRTRLNYTTNPYQTDQFGGSFGDFRIYVVRSKGSTSFGNTASAANIFGISNPTPPYNQTYKTLNFAGKRYYSLKDNPQGLNVSYSLITAGVGDWVYSGTIETDLVVDPNTIEEDEKIMIWFGFDGVSTYRGLPLSNLIDVRITCSQMTFDVIYDDTIAVENSAIIMSKILPNMKQKDFIANIMRMFNLYIDPKKDVDRTFLIEPRDEYYTKYQSQKDWSQKLDLSKPIVSEIASNLQPRTNILTYKEDKDYLNTEYKNITNTLFGEYKFEYENEFSSDEKKIELIFSPTPIKNLSGANQMYIPQIFGYNNGNLTNLGGFNPRILYAKTLGLTAGDQWRFWKNGYNIGTSSVQNVYPYASFADDPLNPNISLNFGTIQPFYPGYNETINNLYYTYWANTFYELNQPESRIVEAYFNLTSYDINNFSFADIVYMSVDNMAGYYRVNKIMDYDPSKYESTKVQMVKALNYTLEIDADAGDCPVSLQKCLCGPDITTYLEQINTYYYSLTPYFTMNFNGEVITTPLSQMGSYPLTYTDIVDTINGATFLGMSATYYPQSSTCSLNFQVEMDENASSVFLGTLNAYWEDSPGSAYVAIYVDYPCGSTFGTWVEGYNVFFLDLNSGVDQYTFLDLWLNLIPGAYGTASGEVLAEGAYLQLGWNWVADCSTQSNVDSLYFTIDLNSTQVDELVSVVNDNYDTGCSYLTFWNTYANGAYNFTASTGNDDIGDIVDWANTIFGMSASFLDGGGVRFYYRQDGVICDTCNNSYIAKLTMNDTIGSPAPNYVCYDFGFVSDIQQYPCVSECYGENLNLYICLSNTDYLPGGWTPDLFCDSTLLAPDSGPVYDEGGLTYGVNQNLCICDSDSICFNYETTLPCPGGLYTLSNYISDATGEEQTAFLWETFDDCSCELQSMARFGYQEQSTGFRPPMPLDNAQYLGVINTSSDNLITAPNNIVIGENNNVYERNNIIIGDNNGNITGGFNFVLGQSNSIVESSNSPSVLIGENIYNEIPGGFVFGNNISLYQPFGLSGSTASGTQSITENIFIVGSNLILGGSSSLPSNTTYLGTENIIISQDGGFNPPFIISDAISTTNDPTGQSIIKTITGYYPTSIIAGDVNIILDSYVNDDILTDQTPIIVEANVRLEATIPGFPPTYECGVVSLFGVFTKNGGSYELVGSVDKVEKNNFSVLDKSAYLTDTLGNINLNIESIGSDLCNFYWDITFRYRYE
jgi:hypothetical protein